MYYHFMNLINFIYNIYPYIQMKIMADILYIQIKDFGLAQAASI